MFQMGPPPTPFKRSLHIVAQDLEVARAHCPPAPALRHPHPGHRREPPALRGGLAPARRGLGFLADRHLVLPHGPPFMSRRRGPQRANRRLDAFERKFHDDESWDRDRASWVSGLSGHVLRRNDQGRRTDPSADLRQHVFEAQRSHLDLRRPDSPIAVTSRRVHRRDLDAGGRFR